ncbi:MAG TPA: DUF3499 family protein [Euzebyales bacterium]|nr:DUF3499 family protein [Euzebyales bacterium]
MSDRERVCQRAGCQRSASVTLTFRSDARQASLGDLTDQKHPAHYDLCGGHADVLIVPKGWERLDRRTQAPDPTPEIDAFVRGIEQPAPPPPPRLDRYAALTADLPRLAEACGLTVPDHDVSAARRYGGDLEPAPHPYDGAAPATRLYEPVTGTIAPEEQVIEGQLQMPIEPEPDGVVVALLRTRQV